MNRNDDSTPCFWCCKVIEPYPFMNGYCVQCLDCCLKVYYNSLGIDSIVFYWYGNSCVINYVGLTATIYLFNADFNKIKIINLPPFPLPSSKEAMLAKINLYITLQ